MNLSRATSTLGHRVEVTAGPGARRLLSEAAANVRQHDIPGLAAELGYHGTLALLPFLILLAALPPVIGSIFDVPNVGERIASEVLFSDDVANALRTLVDEVSRSHGFNAVLIGLVGTLWAGTSATATVRKALNRIYGFKEEMPFLRRKLYEAGLTVLVDSLVLAAFSLALLGPKLVSGSHGPVPEVVFTLAAMLLVVVAVALLYWLAPASEHTFRWITPGAAIFAVVWLLFSSGFNFYISHFADVNRVYGSLGIMLIVLVWLYWSSFTLFVGAEVNAIVGHRYDPGVRAHPHDDGDTPRKRLSP